MRDFTELEHHKFFSMALIKNHRNLFPTFESLPRSAKPYFARLEDGSYVQKGAFRLAERTKKTSSDILSALHEDAKRFEPFHLKIREIVDKAISDIYHP